jgi:hypothetical protein
MNYLEQQLTVAAADILVRYLTNGKCCVSGRMPTFWLFREGDRMKRVRLCELNPAGIREVLDGWQDWTNRFC